MSTQTLFTVVAFHALVLFFPAAMILLWRRPQLWIYLLVLFLGAVTGLISLRTDDPQFPALLLLVFAAFSAFQAPRRAWIFVLLLASWVPLMALAGAASGIGSAQPSALAGSLIAFLPAGIGAAIGCVVHRAARPAALLLN